MIRIKLDDVRTVGLQFSYPKVLSGLRTTRCELYDLPESHLKREVFIAMGTAKCSKLDNFEKEKGRKTALARAMKNARLHKDVRVKIWSGYFNRFEQEKK